MAIGAGDAIALGGIVTFGLAVVQLLSRLVDRSLAARSNGQQGAQKLGQPHPQVPPAPVIDPDCRDRIVETHVIVQRLADAQSTQAASLQRIEQHTAVMANSMSAYHPASAGGGSRT